MRAFLAVADQGSANRASASLVRAQSGVSRSIHKLEADVGAPLFERRARGTPLTEYGRALLVREAHLRRDPAREERSRSGRRQGQGAQRPRLQHAGERASPAGVRRTRRATSHAIGRGESGITQPAVSMALRELEDSIGVPLFARTARNGSHGRGAALALRLKRALTERDTQKRTSRHCVASRRARSPLARCRCRARACYRIDRRGR